MPAYMLDLDHQPDDQVFSYWHGEKLIHFNVGLLRRMHKIIGADGFRRITMEITEAEYELCVKHRGIEEDKVAALTGKQLREPGYGAIWPDGSFTMVDGHHRVVRRYRGNVKTMDFWVCHEHVWKHCLVDYPPEFEAILAESIPERVMEPADIQSKITLHDRED